MKPCTLHAAILWLAMTPALLAETPTARFITRKSILITARTMNNVEAVMQCDGIRFVIPPVSIDTSLLVAIYQEEGTLTVKSGKPGDRIARLAVDIEKFDGPVEVHIPMANSGKVPIAYAVDKSDAWEPLTLKEVSPDKATAIYLTYKPVTVAWVIPE